jgi:UDP-glucuronate 4-epimerase
VTIIVTGVAGFIGFYVARALLARGEHVVGVDNLNDYYDVRLKHARLAQLPAGFDFVQADVSDRPAIEAVFARYPKTRRVIHLAAQAGVRHSMVDPYAYVASNVMGHVVMLEAARRLPALEHFVFASSSSVYGLNTAMPFSEDDRVDTPSSLYAATKRADELIGHAYAHLFQVPQTGLRFFTVYGPWGRPDMAYYGFARAIVAGEPITLYDGGTLRRDFTYIDDIVTGLLGAADVPPAAGEPVRILNIGNHRSESVLRLVELLERGLGRKAVIQSVPRPLADVPETFADVGRIAALVNFSPKTELSEGVDRFVGWFRTYHNVKDGEGVLDRPSGMP